MSHRTAPRSSKSLRPWLAAGLLAAACSSDPSRIDPVGDEDPMNGGQAGAGGRGGGGAGGRTDSTGGRGGGGSGGGGAGGQAGGGAGAGGAAGSGGAGGAGSGGRGGSSAADAGAPDGGRDAGGTDTAGSSRDGGGGGADAQAPVAAFAVCAVCHGAAGEGSQLGPEIQHPVRDFSTWVVRNGRMHPGFMMAMPKYTTDMLSMADLNRILDFLAAPPKPTTGAALYKDFCANCHGADGKGGVTMRPITTQTATQYVTNVRGGHHAGEFGNRREYMPKWTAAQLSDAEINRIFTFVTTGK